MANQNKTAFTNGIRDGSPIALGYFAVAFSLGIVARKAGLTPFQGFLSSILNHACLQDIPAGWFVRQHEDQPADGADCRGGSRPVPGEGGRAGKGERNAEKGEWNAGEVTGHDT